MSTFKVDESFYWETLTDCSMAIIVSQKLIIAHGGTT